MEGGIIVSVNPRWVGLRTAGCLEVEVIIMTFDKVLKKVSKRFFFLLQINSMNSELGASENVAICFFPLP